MALPYDADGDSKGGEEEGGAGVGNSTRWACAGTAMHNKATEMAIASHGVLAAARFIDRPVKANRANGRARIGRPGSSNAQDRKLTAQSLNAGVNTKMNRLMPNGSRQHLKC
jgi:hypothetical protein